MKFVTDLHTLVTKAPIITTTALILSAIIGAGLAYMWPI